MIYSLSIHALVILLFAFLMAWREPNPPLPEYGIELNFGLDDAGSGDTQPLTPAVESENLEDAAPEEETIENQETEIPQETTEETIEKTETFEDPISPDLVEKSIEDIEKAEIVEEQKEEVKSEPKEQPSESKPVEVTEKRVSRVRMENQKKSKLQTRVIKLTRPGIRETSKVLLMRGLYMVNRGEEETRALS